MVKEVQYCSIYITARDGAEARKIGKTLVEERLVACVNIFPVNSLYRWEGKIEEAREVALIAKSQVGLVDKIIRRVKELHSDEVPCVVSWPIHKGNPEYLAWIKESTESGEDR